MRQLIDGYNVLFQSGHLGKGRGPGFLERARGALLRAMAAAMTAEERAGTTVVFDAHKTLPGLPAEQEVHGLRVLFAHNHDDADALLEDLIAQCPHPKQLTVVSSDRRIQTAARRRRATVQTADQWLGTLQTRRIDPPAIRRGTSEKPEAVPEETLDEWRAFFDLDRLDLEPLEVAPNDFVEPASAAPLPRTDSASSIPSLPSTPASTASAGSADGAVPRERHRLDTSEAAEELDDLPDPFPPGFAEPL